MKEKIVSFAKKQIRQKSFWFIGIFTIFNLAMTVQVLRANGVGHFWIVALVEIIFEAVFIYLIKYSERKKWSIQNQFLIAAVMLGLGFLVLLPPGMAPDDTAHFKRAYGISTGVFLPGTVDGTNMAGSELPVEVDGSFMALPQKGAYEKIGEIFSEDISGETSWQTYPNTSVYHPLMYSPQVFGALIGRMFKMSFLGMAYLMEIFNYAVFVLLVYFAIKLIPKFKMIVLFVALNPMTLQEATSLSLDGLAIGLSMFLIAYVCYLIYDAKKVMSKKQLLVLYVLAVLIGLCKMVYAPLILLFFLIPYQRFGSKKKKWIHAGIMAAIFIAVNLSWLMLTSGLLDGFNFKPNANINAHEQAMVIIKNPIKYLSNIVSTTNSFLPAWMTGILGTSLGAFCFNLPTLYFYFALGFVIMLFAQREDTLKIEWRSKLVFWLVFGSIIMMIFLSEYLQWTDVGTSFVDGIQGRYFLPILLLIPILVARKDNKSPHMNLITKNAILYFGLFMNVAAFVVFFANNA